eukprot:GHVH01006835.1.p1 GENE.GHVH01006835.1~~GHVH01006835.1.p1  ORF type:complete len:379 (-),score=45.92 GHVH01006835.1:126-1262(-)
MKLCSHPSLLTSVKTLSTNFKEAKEFLDDGLSASSEPLANENRPPSRTRRVSQKCGGTATNASLSGKFKFLANILSVIARTTTDRVVIISNFTQTLDLIGGFCKASGYHCVRLDGSMAVGKRHALVCKFNDLENKESFVFLLSSKAGGCGINLIGANRLIMFDPDWNPANDKQALARIWRDGQKKQCYIYRLFSVGTIEEKIYQRQIRKGDLGAMVVTNDFAEAEVIESLAGGGQNADHGLFDTIPLESLSSTHDLLRCRRCDVVTRAGCSQKDHFVEDDLNTWAHHFAPFIDLDDEVFRSLDFEKTIVPIAMTARIEFIEPKAVTDNEVPLAPVDTAGSKVPATPQQHADVDKKNNSGNQKSDAPSDGSYYSYYSDD